MGSRSFQERVPKLELGNQRNTTLSPEDMEAINKRNGEVFLIEPAVPGKSPLDIQGVDLGISSSGIVHIVREGREGKYG